MASVNFDLYDPAFVALTRVKYTKRYTRIAPKAFSPLVYDILQKLFELIGEPLVAENTPLTVLASTEGFAQRLLAPKVFQEDGDLILRIGQKNYPIEIKSEVNYESEDDEKIFTFFKKIVTFTPVGRNTYLAIKLGKNTARFPIYVNNLPDDQGSYSFDEVLAALEGGPEQIKAVIGTPTSSSNGINFSQLKYLALGLYTVLEAQHTVGSYGPKVDLIITPRETVTVEVANKNPETGEWQTEPKELAPNAKIKVQANTDLTRALMGETFAGANVLLNVISKRVDNGKTFVNAAFDFSESPLRVDLD